MTREEAIAVIKSTLINIGRSNGKMLFAEAINTAIKALEHTEQRWIPCSERLPEIGKSVLLSEPTDMMIAEYHGNGSPDGLWLVDNCHHYISDIDECAWMPLPEPYREEGEEDESD